MSLRARSLHLSLGGRQVLNGIGLTARPGDFSAIIGPNGSGKTTLLRALTGEIAPQGGTITLNGQPIDRLAPETLARRRAVLPQHSALGFSFNVAEIVSIGLATHVGTEAERARLIRAALGLVGLPGHAGRLWQELSGGEQQRVQLARALVQVWQPVGSDGPRWLLLDEPVSSLDIAQQLTVMRLARDYATRGGGVIAVMHDLNLTAMFADHVLLMQNGHALAEGRPADVITDDLLSRAYGCALRVRHAPEDGVWLLPHGAVA